MIRLIVGNKGYGKTKKIVELANNAVKETKGNVIFIEKGTNLTYDIDHKARLVDIEQYGISCFKCFYGFFGGLYAGNYDITDIFVDATLKIGGRDLEAFADMVERLANITKDADSHITFTVSCDPSELPERIKQYMLA